MYTSAVIHQRIFSLIDISAMEGEIYAIDKRSNNKNFKKSEIFERMQKKPNKQKQRRQLNENGNCESKKKKNLYQKEYRVIFT